MTVDLEKDVNSLHGGIEADAPDPMGLHRVTDPRGRVEQAACREKDHAADTCARPASRASILSVTCTDSAAKPVQKAASSRKTNQISAFTRQLQFALGMGSRVHQSKMSLSQDFLRLAG